MQRGLLEQQNILAESTKAVLCIDDKHEISYMNKGAQLMFNLNSEDINQPIFNNKLFTNIKEIKKDKCFKTQVLTKDKINKNILVVINPIIKEKFLGATIIGIENALVEKALNTKNTVKKDKRTFDTIRNSIIICLAKNKKTINQLSLETGINWKTVEKHLTFLQGKKLIEEIFSSEYLRVFDITEKGKQKARDIQQAELSKYIKVD